VGFATPFRRKRKLSGGFVAVARSRVGIWLIGAKGGVGTAALVGLCALQKGLIGREGLVSGLPRFAALDLTDWNDFVCGGHDIRPGSLYDHAHRSHGEPRAIDPDVLVRCKSSLARIDANLRPGVLFKVGETIEQFAPAALRRKRDTPRAGLERVEADLADFQSRHKLAHTVVVNVASTEPGPPTSKLPPRWRDLEKLLEVPRKCPLPASSLYAIAAIRGGCSYVNFTPSLGGTPRAIGELVLASATRQAGFDGKTGETLLKSALAPLFAARHLEVMSWVGHNILGNLDGKVLDNPANKKSKIATKDNLLRAILGYAPQSLVSLEFIESLGDWKTAWDHVHFKGFFGTPMTLQFTWQGCDSLLAAPLVLDLVRFTERAHRAGDVGTLVFLSSFFKSPLDCDEHDFARQFQRLEHWAASTARQGA
jgi:myo-inositol-1-phosphate synthase